MKTRTVQQLHKCDICGEDAYYDCKTTQGPWANLCENHFREIGLPDGATKFKLPDAKNPPEKKVLMGICLTDMEDAVFDGIVEWECPSCGDVRSMEPDAYCIVECENCGQKYKVMGFC